MTHTLVINHHHLQMLMRSSFPHYTDEERADLLKMFLNSVSAANSQEPPRPTFYVPSDFMTTKYGHCTIAATYRGDPDGMCTRGLYAEPLASDNVHSLVKEMIVYLREIIAEGTYGEHGTKNLAELVNEATAWLERGVEPDQKPLPDAHGLPAWLIKSVENLYKKFMAVQQGIVDKNDMPLSDAQIACQELLEAARLIKHVVSYSLLFNAINEAVKLDKTRKVISVEDFRNYISDAVERIVRKAGGGA